MPTNTLPAQPLTRYDRLRQRTQRRNRRLYDRYYDLFESQRLRYDDVLSQVADEFLLATSTVERIVRSMEK